MDETFGQKLAEVFPKSVSGLIDTPTCDRGGLSFAASLQFDARRREIENWAMHVAAKHLCVGTDLDDEICGKWRNSVVMYHKKLMTDI